VKNSQGINVMILNIVSPKNLPNQAKRGRNKKNANLFAEKWRKLLKLVDHNIDPRKEN
jgi:hypothetical protein